ncbi:MAG: uracil phosphoribosyltransferase [Microthrixaceae bacterium]
MDALARILAYEALRHVEVAEVPVTTPLSDTVGVRIEAAPYAIPVLRAGLGLLAGVLHHLPDAPTAFIGVARDEETLVPVPYLNSLPDDLSGRDVLLLTRCWPPAVRWRTPPGSSPNAIRAASRRSACWPPPRAWPPCEAVATSTRWCWPRSTTA